MEQIQQFNNNQLQDKLVRPSEINLPVGIKTVEPNLKDFSILNKEMVAKQVMTSGLIDFVQSEDTLCIVNDGHRATPSQLILEQLAKIENHKITTIIIATGTHGPPTQKEIDQIIGGYDKLLKAKVIVHDSMRQDLVMIGTTSKGTEVWINPIVKSFKRILCINSVEPHYFAGFTGGIKSLVPGLAAKGTVEKNHSWALDEKSEPLNIETNPLPLDLWETRDMIKAEVYGIQMVSVGKDIYGIHTDELRTAFMAAVEQSRKILSVKLDRLYDVIVSIVYPPLDRSLYQAQKGIENTRQVLKPGGEMILLAECHEGIGNTAFYDTIIKYNHPREVMDALNRENYHFGDHKAYKFASLTNESNLTLIGQLDESQTSKFFAKHMELNQLENYLREMRKLDKEILVVLDSGTLVVTR